MPFADFADASALTGVELVPLLQNDRGVVADARWVGNLGSNTVTGLVAGTSAAAANTALIRSYLTSAETAGGGVVVVPAGTWYINATLNLGSRVVLRGVGWGSKLIFAAGASTSGAPKSMVAAKASTNYVGVEDLYLDFNKASQTSSGNNAHCVDFTRSGTEGSGPPVYDGGLYVRDVMAFNATGTGFCLTGDATTIRAHHCFAYHCDVDGFFGKTDCIFTDCDAGNNGYAGFEFYAGTSIIVANCKAFGGPNGFVISYSNTAMFTGCTAEDFVFRGFTCTASSHVTYATCQAYRCTGSDSLRSGFWVEDDGAGNLCKHVVTRSCSVLGGGAGGVAYALWTRNLGVGCDFELHTETLVTARWRPYSGAQDCRAVFSNAYLSAVQNPTFASSYTPDPYLGGTVVMTLTGNITVNAPAEPYAGQELRFIFTQDGTGGRTTTFNAAFKTSWTPNTTAGKVNTITFEYSGSNWVQTSSVVGL